MIRQSGKQEQRVQFVKDADSLGGGSQSLDNEELDDLFDDISTDEDDLDDL